MGVFFAVPGDVTRSHSRGTNNLIRQGAILATSALDVLSEYKDLYINILKEYINKSKIDNKKEIKSVEEKAAEHPQDERFNNLSELSKRIVLNLSLEPVHFDALLNLVNATADELTSELMMLEIDGFVKTLPGKNFILMSE